MNKLVAIIAPMMTDKPFHAEYRIFLNSNRQELNIKVLYDFITNNFEIKNKTDQYSYKEDTIPAAGFYLSSKLRKAGYDTILDHICDDSTIRNIALKNPIAICISTTMISRKNTCLTLIQKIRNFMPDVKIIIGGIFVWKSYLIYLKENKDKNNEKSTIKIIEEDWKLFNDFDIRYKNCLFITSHHGLSFLFRVLKEIEKGEKADFMDIPNLIIPDNNKLQFTRFSEDNFNINEEYTHWELLDSLPQRIPIRTSIGCPYTCNFCDFCVLYPKLVTRNMDSIYKELTTLKAILEARQKSALLHFTDDNIFITQERLNDICKTIIESEIQIPWISFMRASSVNESNIDLLRNSNLLLTMMGIESGDPAILQAMNKKQNLKEIKAAIELLDENRISVLMYFIVGFPGETSETLENTATFLNNLHLKNIFTSYQLFPFKIPELSNMTSAENRKRWNLTGIYDKWNHYTMDSTQANKATYELFKKINNIPYHYFEETKFFLYRFNYEQRKKIFNLRKDLTIAVFEKAETKKIQTIFTDIALTMGLPGQSPNHEIISQLNVPDY